MRSGAMQTTDTNIVDLYAQHLFRKASSLVTSFASGGALVGAAVAAVPGFLSHSVLVGRAEVLAVVLGAIAGGLAGRSIGERRAVGLRLQAQLALHQSRAGLQAQPVPVQPVAPQPVAQPVPQPVPVAPQPFVAVPAPAPVAALAPAPVSVPVTAPPVVAAPPVAAPAPPPVMAPASPV